MPPVLCFLYNRCTCFVDSRVIPVSDSILVLCLETLIKAWEKSDPWLFLCLLESRTMILRHEDDDGSDDLRMNRVIQQLLSWIQREEDYGMERVLQEIERRCLSSFASSILLDDFETKPGKEQTVLVKVKHDCTRQSCIRRSCCPFDTRISTFEDVFSTSQNKTCQQQLLFSLDLHFAVKGTKCSAASIIVVLKNVTILKRFSFLPCIDYRFVMGKSNNCKLHHYSGWSFSPDFLEIQGCIWIDEFCFSCLPYDYFLSTLVSGTSPDTSLDYSSPRFLPYFPFSLRDGLLFNGTAKPH